MKCKELIDECNERLSSRTGGLMTCVDCPYDSECEAFIDAYGVIPRNEDKLHNGMYYTDAEVGD